MRTNLFLTLGIILLSALLIGGCTPKTAKCDTANWQDITWKLKSYGLQKNLKTAIPGYEITLLFSSKGKTASGSTVCNSYSSSYTADKSTCKIKIPDLMQTERACLDQNLMQQEQQYLKSLPTAAKIQVINGELHITCGENLLVFTR
jgi:heat shock protein HslJ